MKKEEKVTEAKLIAEAWQTLYYSSVMNDKESTNIFKKIKTKYGKLLNLK